MNFRVGNDNEQEPIFQMTAMVDVVFMLLAFFVLASEFRLTEGDVATGYSEAGELSPGGAASVDFPSDIPISLRPTPGGVGIRIAQARLPDNDFDGIFAKLSEINLPSVSVRILADPQLTVEQVAQAMDAVGRSPMKKMSISQLRVAVED